MRSDVQDDIEHPSSGTPNQLRLQPGCFLIMHTPDCSLPHTESHVSLYRHEIEGVLCELANAPCPHETAAMIRVRPRIDQLGPKNVCISKAHATIGKSYFLWQDLK
jgi:hypothetical protein